MKLKLSSLFLSFSLLSSGVPALAIRDAQINDWKGCCRKLFGFFHLVGKYPVQLIKKKCSVNHSAIPEIFYKIKNKCKNPRCAVNDLSKELEHDWESSSSPLSYYFLGDNCTKIIIWNEYNTEGWIFKN